jgi:putative ABC transport system permease protein
MYNENNRMLFKIAQTMMYFTCIAILIALVGLFSLLSFSLKRKVKEIGIRKIMGASVKNIYFYLSKEFIILLIISNIIAVPLGLKLLGAIPFTYTPEFNIVPILMVVLSSFVVTLLSISYWVLKTARANPVDSLRYE